MLQGRATQKTQGKLQASCALTVATLLTADQPVPRDHGFRTTHTTEELFPRDSSCEGTRHQEACFRPVSPPTPASAVTGHSLKGLTWADVLPQNQKLGIVLKLDQTHLPSTVHLEWMAGDDKMGARIRPEAGKQ